MLGLATIQNASLSSDAPASIVQQVAEVKARGSSSKVLTVLFSGQEENVV